MFGKNARQIVTENPLIYSVEQKRTIHLFFSMAQKIREIHRAGFIHGDLQPAHFIISDCGINVIDWALSHRPDNLEFPYKGALYHFVAPETAKQMYDNTKRVSPHYSRSPAPS